MMANLPPDEAARALVDLANLRGGHDNITCIIVHVKHPQLATTAHSKNSLESLQKLYRYEINGEKPVGRGGCGHIWRANDMLSGKDVAIKTISENLIWDSPEKAMRTFRKGHRGRCCPRQAENDVESHQYRRRRRLGHHDCRFLFDE